MKVRDARLNVPAVIGRRFRIGDTVQALVFSFWLGPAGGGEFFFQNAYWHTLPAKFKIDTKNSYLS